MDLDADILKSHEDMFRALRDALKATRELQNMQTEMIINLKIRIERLEKPNVINTLWPWPDEPPSGAV